MDNTKQLSLHVTIHAIYRVCMHDLTYSMYAEADGKVYHDIACYVLYNTTTYIPSRTVETSEVNYHIEALHHAQNAVKNSSSVSQTFAAVS